MAGPQIVGGTQLVTGAEQFASALRKMPSAVKREFDKQNRVIAGLVIARGVTLAASVGAQQAKAAQSMKPTSQRGGVGIRLGAGIPFALGAEFGAKKYPQFPPFRGNQWASTSHPDGVGYFMHPAIAQSIPEISQKYQEGLQAAARASGLRMTVGNASLFDIARTA